MVVLKVGGGICVGGLRGYFWGEGVFVGVEVISGEGVFLGLFLGEGVFVGG